MKKEVFDILRSIRHPETGTNLEESGMIAGVSISDDRIAVTLKAPKPRDPFMKSLAKQTGRALEAALPAMAGKIAVEVIEPAAAPAAEHGNGLSRVKHIIGVASGKGGVGKSTVAANLAVTLAREGYRTGLLDADIYGPSQPIMFGVEGYMPPAEGEQGQEAIVPAEAHGVKLMSIGFFITPKDALAWRGPMASGALKQIMEQTDWGELDYLLIDMPPGTGDIHLTLLQDAKIDGVVIVTTPQRIAYADAERGIALFKSDKVAVPVLGVIENMAWFTPAELPENKYYIFGKGGGEDLAKREGIELLGQIPVTQSVMEGAENGTPGVTLSEEVAGYYRHVARRIVEKAG